MEDFVYLMKRLVHMAEDKNISKETMEEMFSLAWERVSAKTSATTEDTTADNQE